MYLVKDKKPILKIVILNSAGERITYAADSFKRAVYDITGANLEVERVKDFNNLKNCLVIALKNDLHFLNLKNLSGYDGFQILEKGTNVYVVGENDFGAYYGVHDLLEKNTQIIWSRGAEDLACDYNKCDNIELKVVDYSESSPFPVRCFNICGKGSTNVNHFDRGTAEYLGKNKINGILHLFPEEWRKYGVYSPGKYMPKFNHFEEYEKTHPEYFMSSPDGIPMTKVRGSESTLNFYNSEIANIVAQKLALRLDENGQTEDVLSWIMPDDPYFAMIENGVKLHEQPFTADDGTVVYPEDKNYKSTVYYNFMNRVMRRLNEIRPNSKLYILAYMYAEECPAISVDERLTVVLCPILTNDKYSYIDQNVRDNEDIRKNILAWKEKTNNFGLYMYWANFDVAHKYSRPSLKVMKEDLLWFEQLGVRQIVIESRIDCTYAENLTNSQLSSRNGYTMNEFYFWALKRLMWNPHEDIKKLQKKYCDIVYKECSNEMNDYFNILQKGWDSRYANVWYPTGCDVFYYQFVVKAGISDELKKVLEKAKREAKTPSVITKINTIHETVFEEIQKYENFVKEDAHVLWTDGEDVLSQNALDYVNNEKSVWNRAKALTVLRDYSTMEFYPKEAKFSCRIIYDSENIYFGYTIFDDQIAKTEPTADGQFKILREDGTEVVSYAETYIGGNHLNQEKYFGYISGWQRERGYKGKFYENVNTPNEIPFPKGLKDVKFCNLSEDKNNRYYFHVQVIPISGLESALDVFMPYGSFVYYTDRYKRAGWQGYGLWSKSNFSEFKLDKRK